METSTNGAVAAVEAAAVGREDERGVAELGFVAGQRGERPNVPDYLDRAGADRDVLGRMIDVYLVEAPIEAADEATVVLVNARLEGRTAIAELRERRGVSVPLVVEQLRERLGLAQSLTERLREAYEDLERDWLDPRGVKPSVWAALKSILGLDVRQLVPHEGEPGLAAVLMRRSGQEASKTPAAAPEVRPRDEVDELFRGTPDA